MSTAVVAKQRTPVRPARILLHTFLIVTALAWLAPLLWAVFAALRPYSETSNRGYVSWPHKLSFEERAAFIEHLSVKHGLTDREIPSMVLVEHNQVRYVGD